MPPHVTRAGLATDLPGHGGCRGWRIGCAGVEFGLYGPCADIEVGALPARCRHAVDGAKHTITNRTRRA